jgi:hypothetical protein
LSRNNRGSDDPDNLALACHHDNDHKGPNLSGIDPETAKVVRLFNPRRQQWSRHFYFDGPRIVGRTQTGRATVEVLALNALDRVNLRAELAAAGIFPPSD